MIETTLAAAAQLRGAVRAAGLEGEPGVRIRRGGADRPDQFELTVETRTELGDVVHDSRGIRFFVDPETARRLGAAVLDLDGLTFVLKRMRTGG